MAGRPGYRTMEMIGGSSASYLTRTPCVPLFCTSFSKGGNTRVFRLLGEGGDHLYCTVEPSPGHSRCREKHNLGLPLLPFSFAGFQSLSEAKRWAHQRIGPLMNTRRGIKMVRCKTLPRGNGCPSFAASEVWGVPSRKDSVWKFPHQGNF